MFLYLGSDETELQTFEIASKNFDTVPFFHSENPELAEHYENKIILLKTYDEGRNDYKKDMITFDNIVRFLNKHRYATVMEFDDDASERIFQ